MPAGALPLAIVALLVGGATACAEAARKRPRASGRVTAGSAAASPLPATGGGIRNFGVWLDDASVAAQGGMSACRRYRTDLFVGSTPDCRRRPGSQPPRADGIQPAGAYLTPVGGVRAHGIGDLYLHSKIQLRDPSVRRTASGSPCCQSSRPSVSRRPGGGGSTGRCRSVWRSVGRDGADGSAGYFRADRSSPAWRSSGRLAASLADGVFSDAYSTADPAARPGPRAQQGGREGAPVMCSVRRGSSSDPLAAPSPPTISRAPRSRSSAASHSSRGSARGVPGPRRNGRTRGGYTEASWAPWPLPTSRHSVLDEVLELQPGKLRWRDA